MRSLNDDEIEMMVIARLWTRNVIALEGEPVRVSVPMAYQNAEAWSCYNGMLTNLFWQAGQKAVTISDYKLKYTETLDVPAT